MRFPFRHYLFPFLLLTLLSAALGSQLLAERAPLPAPQPYLFISPLKAVEPINRGVLFGGGVLCPSGWGAEAGYLQLFRYDPVGYNIQDQHGYRIQLGLRRYFLHRPNTPLVPFLSVRTDYLRRSHLTEGGFVTRDIQGNDYYQSDTTGVVAKVYTLNLIGGVDWAIGRHLAIEFSGGLGYRWRDVQLADRSRPEDYRIAGGGGFDFDFRNDVGRNQVLNLPLDIRLLYRW